MPGEATSTKKRVCFLSPEEEEQSEPRQKDFYKIKNARLGKRNRQRPTDVSLADLEGSIPPHPYGVLPSGNRFFSASTKRQEEAWLPSMVQWQHVLRFADATTIQQLVQVSRWFYVVGHEPELWRDLVLRKCEAVKRVIDVSNKNVCGWKDLYVHLFATTSENVVVHRPIAMPGMYCDDLYQSHRCRSFAIPQLWLQDNLATTGNGGSVRTRTVNEWTRDLHHTLAEGVNEPVLIKGAALKTPAFVKWQTEFVSSQQEQQPGTTETEAPPPRAFRATSGAAPLAASFTLEAYENYVHNFTHLEESPLYLFDRTAFRDNPTWRNDFFPAFYEACPYWDPSDSKASWGHDLFQHVGDDDKRPDHTWMIVGPQRSGSVFHIDPNATHAWNVCLQGRKRWIFYPPGVAPPGVFPSADGEEVAIPLSVGEWLLQYWDEHCAYRGAFTSSRGINDGPYERPLECTAHPGDAIFVPHGWWHMVINLDRGRNLAITHNYVSPSNLGNVLRFLQDKQEQISGCRDRPESIQPEALHDALVTALKEKEPDYLKKAQEQVGWTCKAWKNKDDPTPEQGQPKDEKETQEPSDGTSGSSIMSKADKESSFSFSFL